jgi:hypothetical protein
MEYKALYPFVLSIILVGMLIGVGVLALDKFGTAAKDETTAVTLVTILGQTGQLPITSDVEELVSFTNSTASFTPGVNVNVSSAGVLTTSPAINGTLRYNATYRYLKSGAAVTALNSGRQATSEFSTVWLGLIVTIAVLAIILTLVMRGFGGVR